MIKNFFTLSLSHSSDFHKSNVNHTRKRQVSSMIHSARPTVSPVANIVFALFCFARFWKVGTDGRTDDICKNNDPYRPWLWVGREDQYEFYFRLPLHRQFLITNVSVHKTILPYDNYSHCNYVIYICYLKFKLRAPISVFSGRPHND